MKTFNELPDQNGAEVIGVYKTGKIVALTVHKYPNGAKTLETQEGKTVDLSNFKGWVAKISELTLEDVAPEPTVELPPAVILQLHELYNAIQFAIDRHQDGDATGVMIAQMGLISERKKLGDLLGKKEPYYEVKLVKP